MDGLDADAVKRAVEAANPDVIVHQMTALTGLKMGKIDRLFEVTNRLRTEGTENLIAAAPAAPDRAVVRGLAVRPHRRAGQDRERPARPRAAEGHPRDPRRDPDARELTVEAGGIVLRYGGFYGPGTGMAPDGDQER